jgi:hypothetical protein
VIGRKSNIVPNTKVPRDLDHNGKLTFTNLKHVVWHEAFLRLLDTICLLSKVGFAYKTFEDVMRTLYPIILILSSNYKEQFATFLTFHLICLIGSLIDV